MKKQTAMALAAVFAMSVAGTALAAPVNPFVDVPAKHWSYDSINQLAKAGVISGYGDGTFQGDKTLTRYEAATLVAKAMANSDKLNPENKKALEALKTEFSAELNNLGVRVSNIESKMDNFKIKGDIRFRYRAEKLTADTGAKSTPLNELIARSRVNFSGSINDAWTYNARIQNSSNMRKDTSTTATNGQINEDSKTEFTVASITGKIFGGTYTFGRQDLFFMDGLLIDDTAQSTFKGAAITYPINKGNVSVFWGSKDVTTDVNGTLAAIQANTKFGVVDFGAGYAKVSDVRGFPGDFHAWEATAGTKIGPDFYFSTAYAKSNANTQNKAYTYKVAYKTFDYTKVNSFSPYVQYRHMDSNSTIDSAYNVASFSTYDLASIKTAAGYNGFKGYEVGFLYAPWKNVEFKTWYVDGKTTNGPENKDKFIGSYFRFWF